MKQTTKAQREKAHAEVRTSASAKLTGPHGASASAEAYVKEAEQKVEAVEASLQKIAEARAARAARGQELLWSCAACGMLALPGGASFSQGHRGLAFGRGCAAVALFSLPGIAPEGSLHGHRGLRVGCKTGAGGSRKFSRVTSSLSFSGPKAYRGVGVLAHSPALGFGRRVPQYCRAATLSNLSTTLGHTIGSLRTQSLIRIPPLPDFPFPFVPPLCHRTR